jgi:hypothetical protein
VFADLFDEDGDELYMQSLAHYGVPAGQSYVWGQLQDAVRANGDLLLGYLAKWVLVVLLACSGACGSMRRSPQNLAIFKNKFVCF